MDDNRIPKMIYNFIKAEEMWEDLDLDGKIKTSPMGSGLGQWAHTLMFMMMDSEK
jgi:hypothetical protein